MRRLGCKSLFLIGCAALLVLCAFSYYWLFYYTERDFYTPDLNDSSDVILAFGFSLVRHKGDDARRIVTPAKWPALDRWDEIHEPVSPLCHVPFDGDLGPWAGTLDDETGHISGVFSVSFDCPDGYYMFDITEVILEREQTGWHVVDWGEICGGVSDDYQCYPADS
jgi:hypothetical protein